MWVTAEQCSHDNEHYRLDCSGDFGSSYGRAIQIGVVHMSERKQLVIFVLLCLSIWLIGIVVLSDKNVDKANYFYYRLKHGNVIRLDGRCFLVPEGWFIAQERFNPKVNAHEVLLGESYKDEVYLSPFFLDTEKTFFPAENSRHIVTIDGGIELYELTIPGVDRIRYWAKDGYEKTILGSKLDKVEFLMIQTREISCG